MDRVEPIWFDEQYICEDHMMQLEFLPSWEEVLIWHLSEKLQLLD